MGGLERGVQRENLFLRLAFSDQGNNRRDRNPQAAKTRDPSHLAGIGRDSLEFHDDPLYPLSR